MAARTIPLAHTVHTACPHDCPDTCAITTTTESGRAIAFTPVRDHPVTRGWLCAKVRPYLDRVYHPDRLTTPLRRTGSKGSDQWEAITWDEALEEITDRWQAAISRSGAGAILPYSYSGTLGLVQMGVASARLWNRMGACGLDRTICDAAAGVAVPATVGAKHAMAFEDFLQSELIVLWGHNPASTSPHFMPFLRGAQKNGATVVLIDPRRTLTAKSVDWHMQPEPGTDAALALGVIHVLFQKHLHDEAWLEAHSTGWRDLRDRAAGYDPERVSEITGIPVEDIERLAGLWAKSSPAVVKIADGLQRNQHGGQVVRAAISIPAVTGQYGILGGGMFYSQSGWITWDSEAVGHGSDSACPPIPRVVNMNRLGAALTGEDGGAPIESLFVFGANPVTSTPNSPKVVDGLLRDDLFTVVHEQFMTDTATYADIVLPATSQLEQVDLHKPYGHHHLQYNAQAIEPLGECRSNWDVMRALAERMGYDEPWLRQEPDAIIKEVLCATARANPLLEGITLERLQREGTVPYSFGTVSDIPFEGGTFPTHDGRIQLRCDAMLEHNVDPLPDYTGPESPDEAREDGSLRLLSGAAHHFVNSSMANQPNLERKEGRPTLEISPADAERLGVSDGQIVRVYNERGSALLHASVTDGVRPGVVVSTKGRWGQRSLDGRNVNQLTTDELSDLGGGSSFHGTRVFIAQATTDDLQLFEVASRNRNAVAVQQ
ncbi:MAG TPA: molybdopterin oxidoreductase family protein [Thermomicrobiales bacterium]|nr:molybdopterin oxidoreductase family protein [Thermomicrobiales bacterium]